MKIHDNQIKKALQLLLLCVLFTACNCGVKDSANDQKEINTMLDSWNVAAAKADFKAYFSCFSEDAIFVGTDACEHWDKKSFMAWAKPYFDKGKTWDFKSIDRHIYFDKTGNTAWFDELLSTRMKICRGSGVVVKQENEWKIKQYVLSMSIPNEITDTVIKLKTQIEDKLIEHLTQKSK
ncbi:MAG: nuclear transport factor 2 family protein [Bacteroidota bacterium]